MIKYIIKSLILIIINTNLIADKGDFEKVSLQLFWKHQFEFAGYYIAKEKGFYKDNNLKVEIKEYDHHIDVINDVRKGISTFGIGNPSLIIDQSKNNNLVMLDAIFQSSPAVLVSLKSSGIKEFKDFKDKRIMISSDAVSTASLISMLKSNDISLDKDMKQQIHSFNIYDLIDGKTDIMTVFTSNELYELDRLGIKYNIFNPNDSNFEFYDVVLFTTQDNLLQNRVMVKKFKEASLKGWRYAFNNIEESVDIILKKYNTQNKTKEALIYEAKVLKKLAFKDNIKFGNIDKNQIQRIYDIYNLMGLVKNKIDLDKFIYKPTKKLNTLTLDEEKYLKKNKIIRMCNNNLYEPIEFAYNGNQNDMRGIAIDTLSLIEKKLNIKFLKVHTKSWKEGQQFLKDKKCDIAPATTQNSQRLKYVNFTEPYLKLPLAILTNEKNGFVSGIEQILDKKILRHQGSGLIKILKDKYPHINIVETKSIKDSFLKLSSGETDYTIATIPIISNMTSKYMIENIHIAGYTNMIYKLGIAVRNDDILLLNILNKSLKDITKKQHEIIYKKWVNQIVKEKVIDYTLLWQILIVILFIILAILYNRFTLKKLNLKLKKEVEAKTKDLKDINKTLEIKIKEEVLKNRKKDSLIYQQTKLASMGEMIGNIAHQWRQPLSIISTASSGMQLQKEYGILTDELFEKACDNITLNSKFLSSTIDDFQDYIKGDTKIVKFNIIDTINSFIKLISSSLQSHEIDIILETEEELELVGYPNQLNQCFVNIFNNAKDVLIQNNEVSNRYMFITQKKIDDNIQITLQDNGGGIDKSIIDKIFEPYFTTKHKSQGTGLGLHMTYSLIVNSMGGTIEVQNVEFEYNSKKQKGAKFIIKLPIKELPNV